MIKAIAFDLDDTLLDTTNLLVPSASQQAYSLMIKAGLKLTPEKCEELRLKLIKVISHRDFFEKLASDFGDDFTKSAAKEAIKLFYEPTLPAKLPLMPGARENIDYLKNKYKLYLVTAGNEKGQRNKVKSLGIEKDFIEVHVVNSLVKARKKTVFLDLIQKNLLKPEELLCIGNSLNSEIKDALEIQAQACYFEFGEDRGTLAECPDIKPDFHIKHHRELITACLL